MKILISFAILALIFTAVLFSDDSNLDLAAYSAPENVVENPVNDRMSKEELSGLLEKITSGVKKNERLTLLTKSYLLYKLGKYDEALHNSAKVGITPINDLKYFIIAESSRLKAQDLSMPDTKKLRQTILNSITNYAKVVLEYPSSPLYEISRKQMIESKILLGDYYLKINNCIQAISIFNQILPLDAKIENSKRASLYSNLGKCYWAKKDFKSAYKAYIKACDQPCTDENLNKKLKILEDISGYSDQENSSNQPKETAGDTGLVEIEKPSGPILVDRETQTFQDMSSYFKQNDYKKFIKHASEFSTKYPGSKYMKRIEDMIVDTINEIMESSKSKVPWGSHFLHSIVDSKSMQHISKMGLKLRIRISSLLYRNEFLLNTKPILESITMDFPKSDFAPRAYLILSRINRILRNYKDAVECLKTIHSKYSGSSLHSYSLFKIGLIYFQTAAFDKALEYFKLYYDCEDCEKAKALWWLGRTLEKMNKIKERNEYYETLKKEYPLSFYASCQGSYGYIMDLISRDNGGNVLDSKQVADLLSLSDNWHFKRALAFLSSGLIDYADWEISRIRGRNKSQVSIYLAYLLSDAGSHRKAISYIASTLPNSPSLIDKGMLKVIFPREYMTELAKQSLLYGIDHILLLSLIKQESAFDESAVSRSGAKGLMQIMPFTADDVSSRLFISSSVPREYLTYPDINIKLSTFYFYKVLSECRGNAICALASYNAGPSRVKEWMNQNDELSTMEFIEHIPVNETNDYVKNITRNYVFYSHILDKKLRSINDLKDMKYNQSILVNQ